MIELMIVIAIIGILAAVALPAYQDYTTRAQASEVVLAASVCRTTVTEVVQTATVLPGLDGWGCESASASSQYVASVSVAATNGTVTVVSQNLPGALGVRMQPCQNDDATTFATCTDVANAGDVIQMWVCGPTAATVANVGWLPGSCRIL